MKSSRKSRKSIRYSIFIGVLAGSVFSASGAFAAIEISTQAGLEAIDSSLNENYVLLNNIVLEGAPTAVSSYVAGNFQGTFDGNNKTISGLLVPLFDVIGGDGSASVRNLNLETSGAGVSGNGVLVNTTYLGTVIENVQVSGDVTGTTPNVGGLVGSFSGDITNSSVTGTVIGTNTAGGLVGIAYGNISDSTFTGTVQGQRYVGGLVGATGSSTISNSSASGIVTGLESVEGNIGGLVGGGSGTISNSTASVAVTGYEGTSNIGGLIGYADAFVQVINSSSSGTVTGTSNVGGVAGQISGSFISNSSSSTAVSGVNNVGGLVGNAIGGSYYGTARGIPSPENGDPGFLAAEIEESHSTGAVNGGTHTGGLVGRLGGDITNSYSVSAINQLLTGDSVGNRLGGLVGVMASGSVSDSYATGGGYSLEGYDYVGGLIGLSEGSINNSHASFLGNVSGYGYVGGLIGSTNGNVTNSYSSVTGDVSSTTGYVGGLAGYVGGVISNSYSTVSGDVTGDRNVGGLVGNAAQDITNSYAVIGGDVIGTNAWSSQYSAMGGFVGGLAGSARSVNNSYVEVGGSVTADFLNWSTSPVGGLVGQASGEINNSYASIALDVASSGGYLGGLVGYTPYSIDNSVANIGRSIFGGFNYIGGLVGYFDSTATISDSNSSVVGSISGGSNNYLGGLVGYAETTTTISNSNSNIAGDITGTNYTGGLVGYGARAITNSNTLVSGNITGVNFVGGLIGNSNADISNSDASVQGNLISTGYSAGGLAGYFSTRSISNSNSSISGTFLGNTQYGGLIGSFYGGIITGSFYMLNGVVGGTTLTDLLGYHYDTSFHIIDYTDTSLVWNVSEVPDLPTKLQVLNNALDPAVFAIDECLNGLNPYLVSLFESYESSCGGGDNETPSPRERIVREVMETRTPEKIEKTLGFKNDTPLPKDAVISFLQSTDKIDIAKVKSFEITPNAIVRVSTKTEEALQISLKSESKAPVELWVLSSDGKWLLAGVITFDKDGKAILPPLQFKNTGDYSLVFSTPSADSAKASAPFNIGGQVIVSVT